MGIFEYYIILYYKKEMGIFEYYIILYYKKEMWMWIFEYYIILYYKKELGIFSPLGKSDHSVITLTFNCYLDYSKPKERYLYNKADYDEMKKHLASSHWAQE